MPVESSSSYHTSEPGSDAHPAESPAFDGRLPILLLLAALLYAIPLWWGLGTDRQWAFDEPRPSQIVPEALGSTIPWLMRYPPLHRHLLRGLFHLALPLARTASAARGMDLAAVLQALGRAATIPFALATLFLVYAITRRLAGPRPALLSALIWLGVAPQAYYAKTMNLDAPYLAWFALSVYFFVEFRLRHRLRDLAGFALAGGCSILTKDQAYGLYVLPALAIVFWVYEEARFRGEGIPRAIQSTLLDSRLWVAALALAVQVALVYRVWNGFGELVSHVRDLTGWHAMGRYQEFPNSVSGHLGLARWSLQNLGFCLGWVGFAVCLIAIGNEVRRRRHGNASAARFLELLLFPLSYYLTFVSVIRYSYDRFFLPVAFVLALLAGRLLADLLDAPRRAAMKGLAALGVTLALSYGFARSVIVDLSMLRDDRYEIEQILAEGGPSFGLGRRSEMMPRVSATVPLARFRQHPCELLGEARFVVFQPMYSTGPVGSALRDRLESGAYGFRRIPIRRFEPPRWIYDADADSTNLATINLPTWLYRRDPALPCRAPEP